MTTTLELINAIAKGDASAIDSAFNASMAEKISVKLDDMRVNVAHAMFNAPQIDSTEEQTSEE